MNSPGNTSFLAARRHVALAWYFAWSDMRARYRRSVLGPFWMVLGTMIGVGGIAVIWGTLRNVEREIFVPSLTIGIVTWQMISGSVNGATRVFAGSASIIKNIKTPSLRISLQLLFQQIVNLVHSMVLIAVVLAIYPGTLSPKALLAVPGLFLVFVNLLWVIQFIGLLGARFRDLDPLVSAMMPMLFFMSPVLFRSHELSTRAFLIKLNPLGYWVDIVREPILGDVPSLMTYAVVLAMTIGGWALALWLTRAKENRLPYWL